jgi:hypothetical protein
MCQSSGRWTEIAPASPAGTRPPPERIELDLILSGL